MPPLDSVDAAHPPFSQAFDHVLFDESTRHSAPQPLPHPYSGTYYNPAVPFHHAQPAPYHVAQIAGCTSDDYYAAYPGPGLPSHPSQGKYHDIPTTMHLIQNTSYPYPPTACSIRT